jgi:hypothetical protein
MRTASSDSTIVSLAVIGFAGPKEEALAVLEQWSRPLRHPTSTQSLKPTQPILGTGSQSVVTDQAKIRKYFEATLLVNRPRGARWRCDRQ